MNMTLKKLKQLQEEKKSITVRQKNVIRFTFTLFGISLFATFITKSSVLWCVPFLIAHLIAYRLVK